MAYGRNGRGLLRPSRIGLGLTAMDFTADSGLPVIEDYSSPYSSPDAITAVTSPDSGSLTTPVAEAIPGVTTAPTYTAPVVAMPATTTAATQPMDGSAPITAPVTLFDNTVAPVGSTIIDTPTAQVVTYPDNSTRIVYKNAPPPNDPECRQYSTADINNGLICQQDESTGKYWYIPTESWTGVIQSAGELRANMRRMAELNPKFVASSYRAVWYHNPAWHLVTTAPEDVFNTSKFPDSYKPQSVADYWISYYAGIFGRPLTDTEKKTIRDQVAMGVMPNPQQDVPTTKADTGAKVYVVDPTTGTRIDTTAVSDPNAPITDDGRSIHDIVYPSPPPTTNVILHDDDVDDYSGGGGGGGTTSPPFVPPTTTTPVPRPPTGGGTPNTNVSPAPASGSGMSTATLGLLALGAFLLLKRR